jgi:hypothetical protein
MTSRIAVLIGVLLAAGLATVPALGWQVSAEDHAQHHPAAQAADPKAATPAPQATTGMGMNMTASDAKLDELVKKMNAAQGQAKVDAIAELLTALVQDRRHMHANMAGMMSMMSHTEGGHAK